MKRQQWSWVLLAMGLLMGFAAEGFAQRPAHYYPVRQPISPYFFYGAINTTGLPNYYSYVLPSQQFREFVARTDPQVARFDNRVNLGGDRVNEMIERQLQMRGTTGVGAPAAPATFMEYSHFYRPQQSTRRR